MNFTKLKYVVAVDRAGSISAAAQTLNISQSAVTKAVADMELELGTLLFERRARGIETTPEGRVFVDRAARILSDVQQLGHDVKTRRRRREQLLRVAVTPASLEGLMNRAVIDLLVSDPDARLHMRAVSLEAAQSFLRQGDVDAVVGPFHAFEDEARVTFTQLPPLTSALYVRKDHLLAKAMAVTADDVAKFPVIVPDIQGPMVAPLVDVLTLLGGDPVRRMHIIENYQIASRLVASSDAIGVIMENFAQTKEFSSRFASLDFALGKPIPIALISSKSLKNNAALSKFEAALMRFPPTG